ncbi:unnamed protein product [Prorocentrum cordatum]|uniref:Uncharacterized protein n=1 Tax=Prorocentrum cordatum TaxID=2364126 RepID=A0ABN9RPU1_9DINO|nr:unnamed protein product [Polarella glacialis]
MYDVLKNAAGGETQQLGMLTKVVCAATSGAIGAFAGNPGDLAMVRMQADGKLPLDQRRNYRNFFDAISRIARTEGVPSMWKTGVVPNMNRAAIITVGQLAAYDQCKEGLVSSEIMKERPAAALHCQLHGRLHRLRAQQSGGRGEDPADEPEGGGGPVHGHPERHDVDGQAGGASVPLQGVRRHICPAVPVRCRHLGDGRAAQEGDAPLVMPAARVSTLGTGPGATPSLAVARRAWPLGHSAQGSGVFCLYVFL